MGNSLNELQDLKQDIEKKLERDNQHETYQKELDEINGKIEKSEVCPNCEKEMYSHSQDQAFQCMRKYVKN